MPADPSNAPASAPPLPLAGKEVVVAVCGGIAAYKVCDVVSKLAQAGCGVTVVMTDAARKFVTPLTFQALSGRPVRTDIWDTVDTGDTQHIKLTERADLMLVAPATGNLLAKVAHGFTDDLVSLMISASACPVVFAPAMNHRMWDHPATAENVARLRTFGYRFIGPEGGWLACRNVGMGRMSEPATILEEVSALLRNPPSSAAPIDAIPKSTSRP